MNRPAVALWSLAVMSAIVVGCVFSAILGLLLWQLNRR